MVATTEINLADDIIDVRAVIERFEAIEDVIERDEVREDVDIDDLNEAHQLRAILDDLRGYGGDEQWRGDWYPLSLIADSYFEDYARELADDIGAIDASASWPNNFIDWERAADALKMDYTSVEIDGATYWYR